MLGQARVPDPQFGYGIVDASAAVRADVAHVVANPMGDLAEWIRVYRRANPDATPAATTRPSRRCRRPAARAKGRHAISRRSCRRYASFVLRLRSAPRAHGPGYTGRARRHRCCPTHQIGARFPLVAFLTREGIRSTVTSTAPRILIVGGGYAGFYTHGTSRSTSARGGRSEGHGRRSAPVHDVSALPARGRGRLDRGASRGRRAASSPEAHDGRDREDHEDRSRQQGRDHHPELGEPWEHPYDQIVVTAGRRLADVPHSGIADNAIGLKTIEEALAIRDKILTNLDKAASLPPGPAREVSADGVVVAVGLPASRSSPSCVPSPPRCEVLPAADLRGDAHSTSSRRWGASCPRSRSRRACGS